MRAALTRARTMNKKKWPNRWFKKMQVCKDAIAGVGELVDVPPDMCSES